MANTALDKVIDVIADNGSGSGAIRRLISLGEEHSYVAAVCGLLLLCIVYSVSRNTGLWLAGLTLLNLLTNRI